MDHTITAERPPSTTPRSVGLDITRARLLFRSYLDYANKSPRTVGTYLDAIDLLIDYLQEQRMPTDVGAISGEHLQAFFADLKRRGNSAGTVSNRYRAIRRFFGWLVNEADEGLIRSPMDRMRPPQVPPVEIRVLRQEEIQRLVAACHGSTFEHKRDEALVRLMLDCGLRRAEVLALTYGDLNFDQRLVHVRLGKGRKNRPVRWSKRTDYFLIRYETEWLKRHRFLDRDAADGYAPFWIGKKGALGYTGLRQLLDRRVARARLPFKVHPHMLRHTWAHLNKVAGVNDDELMMLAGWSSREMLARYSSTTVIERALATADRIGIGDGF